MYDAVGGPIAIGQNEIVITKTAVTIDAIPASHTISLAVLNRPGGRPVLEPLITDGESLPKKGMVSLETVESVEAGSSDSLRFYVWEGDIADPITDNRLIGCFKVTGSDFAEGAIPIGADIECFYKILDSGELKIEVSIPSIGGIFDSTGKNFYSPQEGHLDYSKDAPQVAEEGEQTRNRIDHIKDSCWTILN